MSLIDVGALVLLAQGLEVDHAVALGLLDLLGAPDRAAEDDREVAEEVGLVLGDLRWRRSRARPLEQPKCQSAARA